MGHLEQHLSHSECTEEHGILLILQKKVPALSHKAPIFVPASFSHCPSVFLTKLLFICPFSSPRWLSSSLSLAAVMLSLCLSCSHLLLSACLHPSPAPPSPSSLSLWLSPCHLFGSLASTWWLPDPAHHYRLLPVTPSSGTSLAETLPLPPSFPPAALTGAPA